MAPQECAWQGTDKLHAKGCHCYMLTWWALEHGGCRAADGSRFAAPVNLEVVCSHLAVEFNKQGRTREWEGATLSSWLMWHCFAIANMLLVLWQYHHKPIVELDFRLSSTDSCLCRQPNEEHCLATSKKGYKNHAAEQGYKGTSRCLHAHGWNPKLLLFCNTLSIS